MRRRQGGEVLGLGSPASEEPGGVGRPRGGAAAPVLPRPGGRSCQKGCGRRQAGCSEMRGWGAWVEGTGGWDQGGPGWRREQAERKPGQGQRGKRQGADEIQEVDEGEAGPPAGSGGGGGGKKRLAGS